MHHNPSTLEALESRRLLAAVAWDGGGDGGSWTDPLNWDGDAVPTISDDVTIDVAADPTVTVGAGNTNEDIAAASITTAEAMYLRGGTLTLGGTFTTSAQVLLGDRGFGRTGMIAGGRLETTAPPASSSPNAAISTASRSPGRWSPTTRRARS